MQFVKATKSQAKLRASIFGPSGSGKTYSGLSVGEGLAGSGRVGLIDSERGTAKKYSDVFDFDVLDLVDTSVSGYIRAIETAADAGLAVLVIDSLSHAWQQLVEEIDRLAKAKYRGNTWSAWSEGTPQQRKLIDAILRFPGHVIATMRSKTDWSTVSDNGKSRPVRIGLAPEQGKGIEYEFDLLIEMSTEHVANVIKDRTGKFQDKLIEKPGKQFGEQLRAWLDEGEPVKHEPAQQESTKLVLQTIERIATTKSAEALERLREKITSRKMAGDITTEQAASLTVALDSRLTQLEAVA